MAKILPFVTRSQRRPKLTVRKHGLSIRITSARQRATDAALTGQDAPKK